MHRLLAAGLMPVLLGMPSAGEASSGPESPVPPTPIQDSPTTEVPVVTEEEFLAALDELHPAVVEQAQAVALAEAEAVEARTFENPVLAGVREDTEVLQVDWLLSWQLPHPGRGARIDAADQVTRAASSRLTQDIVSLRLAMRRLYAEWAASVARATRLGRQADRIGSLAERESARAERGEASGLEAHRLRLAASELRARAVLAAAEAASELADVRSWHPAVPAGARPQLPEIPPPPSPAEEHPLVVAAEAELEAETLNRKAEGRVLRSPELTFGWQRQEIGPTSLDGPILGFAWPIPLFDRAQAERTAGDARIRAAEARLETVRREIEADREAARAVYDDLARSHAQARSENLDNDRMLDAAEIAFRHGELTLTDLLETLRSVTQSELVTLELRMAALAAQRELVRLATPVQP